VLVRLRQFRENRFRRTFAPGGQQLFDIRLDAVAAVQFEIVVQADMDRVMVVGGTSGRPVAALLFPAD